MGPAPGDAEHQHQPGEQGRRSAPDEQVEHDRHRPPRTRPRPSPAAPRHAQHGDVRRRQVRSDASKCTPTPTSSGRRRPKVSDSGHDHTLPARARPACPSTLSGRRRSRSRSRRSSGAPAGTCRSSAAERAQRTEDEDSRSRPTRSGRRTGRARWVAGSPSRAASPGLCIRQVLHGASRIEAGCSSVSDHHGVAGDSASSTPRERAGRRVNVPSCSVARMPPTRPRSSRRCPPCNAHRGDQLASGLPGHRGPPPCSRRRRERHRGGSTVPAGMGARAPRGRRRAPEAVLRPGRRPRPV